MMEKLFNPGMMKGKQKPSGKAVLANAKKPVGKKNLFAKRA